MTGILSKKRIKLVEEVIGNEDLLLQVLLYLPPKSLMRFKCVSKHWLSLISDPEFCSKHTRLNPKPPILGIYFVYKHKKGFTYESLNQPNSVSINQPNGKDIPTFAHIKSILARLDSDMPNIMHACNGLFLLSYSLERPYLVCNFTTRTFVVLPQQPLPASRKFECSQSAHLVFDPLISPHFKVVLLDTTGFEHDACLHNDDKYKAKSGYCGGGCYEIDVYSSETGVWNRMYFEKQRSYYSICHKVVCNGSLHWITIDKFYCRFEVDTSKLIFNPLPSKPRYNMEVNRIRYFGECCGHLFLIYIPWRNPKTFNVLELDEYSSNWTIKYCVNMTSLMASFPDSFQRPVRNGVVLKSWNFTVLCVVKEEEINGYSLLLSMPGKIVSYNLNRNMFRVLDELPMQEYPPLNSCYYYNAATFPFVANLSHV